MVCTAGQLYGMEAENISNLPQDIHNQIVKKAIELSNTIENAIEAVKVACTLQGACYNNLKEFTILIDILEEKFPALSHRQIATKFNTSISAQYVKINSTFATFLTQLIMDNNEPNLANVKLFFSQGVDPNFKMNAGGSSILDLATQLKDRGTPSYIQIFNLFKVQE